MGLLLKPDDEEIFLKVVRNSLKARKENAALLHGRRVESLFPYVAASLGACVAIKQEDSGELAVADSEVKIPDYRVVLKNSAEFFVEVKNFHPASIKRRFGFKDKYLAGLGKYGQLFNREVYVALYWSRQDFWTLLPLRVFSLQKSVSFGDAVMLNEMVLLGDAILATMPPLRLRMLT